jgi:hypothetical protein
MIHKDVAKKTSQTYYTPAQAARINTSADKQSIWRSSAKPAQQIGIQLAGGICRY